MKCKLLRYYAIYLLKLTKWRQEKNKQSQTLFYSWICCFNSFLRFYLNTHKTLEIECYPLFWIFSFFAARAVFSEDVFFLRFGFQLHAIYRHNRTFLRHICYKFITYVIYCKLISWYGNWNGYNVFPPLSFLDIFVILRIECFRIDFVMDSDCSFRFKLI